MKKRQVSTSKKVATFLALFACLQTIDTSSTADAENYRDFATSRQSANNALAKTISSPATAAAYAYLGTLPSTQHFNTAPPGKDYVKEVAGDGLFCWMPDKFPIKVFIEDSSSVPGYRASYSGVIADCLDEWVKASNGKLAWVKVDNPELANLTVRWTDQITQRETGTEAGNTKTTTLWNPKTNTGFIQKAEMTLLTELPEREFDDAEVKRAYLHEVGHALGIAGHSKDKDDIMYFAVNHNSQHLSVRDVGTLNYLYRQHQPIEGLRAYLN